MSFHPVANVLELCVSIGMAGSFECLAIRLKAVPHLPQHSSNHARACCVLKNDQFGRESTNALARPPQGRFWVSARCGVDQSLEIGSKRGVLVYGLLAPSARSANAFGVEDCGRRLLQLIDLSDSDANRSRRDAEGAGDQSDPAATVRDRFACSKKASCPLVEDRRQSSISLRDCSGGVFCGVQARTMISWLKSASYFAADPKPLS